ncbi:polysaccharide deacetylase family protein [Blautia stercoris]|uniref:Polysaccharide deacetylase family protein n=1 Tax=Blautia stercoris TaxID=871664 RepID=A0ABR7PDJ6_9FIRM|nr:polysaccharide deacetylase family protein [Blautia stercoris]MBC8629342.1 polysaccharide deacetylase family protein [Blautia stercoris]
MDEEQRDELERQRIRHERMMRRKQEKIRQLRRRKMMRIGAMAVVLVFVLVFAGRGVGKLFSGVHIKNSSAKNANSSTVEVQAAEDTGEAGKQPVMSASDVDKLKAAPSIGWHQDENGWWYQNRDGSYYQDGWQEVNGSTYYFNSNGYILTGWQTIDDKDCYFDEDGKYDETKQRPMIALTFDDGPGEYTEELINCLVENNAKATFFMLGQNVEAYPEIAKKVSDAGMELGNHSYSHPDLVTIGAEAAAQQVSNTDAALKAATGFEATVMRPPGGSFNDSVKAAIDHPLIIWSIDTRDWATKSEDQTYQVVMDNAQDGSVVLMHDIHEWSVKAAIRMIPDLIAKGFKLVTVSELAEAKGKNLQSGNAYYYFGEGEQQVE